MARLSDIVRLARPGHWIKNLFVLLPVVSALRVGEATAWMRAALAAAGQSRNRARTARRGVNRSGTSMKTTALLGLAVVCLAGGQGLSASKKPRPRSPVKFVVHRNTAPAWTPSQRQRGFVVCTDHWMRPMFDVFVPRSQDVAGQFECTLARGEYESIQVGVHALKDLADVKMTVKLDLPFKAYRFLSIKRELPVSTSPGKGQLLIEKRPVKMPYYLFPDPQLRHERLAGGVTAGFWITVHAPADAAAGKHSGVIRISAGGKEVDVPLHVQVRPFLLPKPKIAFGMYYDPFDRSGKAFRTLKYQRMDFEVMAAHGMNSLCLYNEPQYLVMSKQGRFDEEKTKTYFGLMAAAGLLDGTQPVMFLSHYWDMKEFGKNAEKCLAQYRALRKKHGLPELLWYTIDEPGGPWPPKIELFENLPLRKAGGKLITSMAGHAIPHVGRFHAACVVYGGHLTKETKRLVEAAGSEFWTYECATHGFTPNFARNFAGLFTWNAGARGNFSWAYTHAHWGGGDYYTVEEGKVKINNGRYYAGSFPEPSARCRRWASRPAVKAWTTIDTCRCSETSRPGKTWIQSSQTRSRNGSST